MQILYKLKDLLILICDKLKKINPMYFFIATYVVFAGYGIALTTVLGLSLLKYLPIYKTILITLFSISIFFNVFIYRVYTYKKFMTHLLITLLIFHISDTVNKMSIYYLWLFLISITGVNFKQISKTVLTVTSIGIICAIIIAAQGYTPNVAFPRYAFPNFTRYSYGFFNPNIFAAFIFQICLALVYIRWKAFAAKDNLFLFASFCLVFFFANSRTTSILILLLMLFVNYCRFWTKTNPLKNLNILANLSLLFCPIFSFTMAKLYCLSHPIAFTLNEILSYRLRNLYFCMAVYPIKMFGNIIRVKNDMHMMSNLYGILLIKYGIFLFVIFIIGFYLLIKKVYTQKDTPLLIILILSLIQCIMEEYFLWGYANLGILAFSYLLNNYNCNKKSEYIEKI